MAAHVAKVHALGMKYMIWYGVPMMGLQAKNYDRFKGKYLWTDHWQGYSCMDPRFPEVRDYICGLYERAMREWDLDGLKLDFIDAIGFRGEDPAVKENYAGRDIKALPEAVDRLLADIRARMTAVKPDALIEYRQSYIGPAIRQYGNMMRAADCPGDLLANRARTANLRLTSGTSAVHADMLEWNAADTPENAARFVLSTMFSVIQYSMMLRELPADHKRMVTHWLDFSRRHKDALLHGGFRPHHFEAFYPWIEGWNDTERIVGVYTEGTVVPVDASEKTNYVLNATGTERVILENAAPCRAEIFDTYGARVGQRDLSAGLVAVEVPLSGYLVCRSDEPLRVLVIGNSFSICALSHLPQVAASFGKPLEIYSLFIPSCTLRQHVENCEKPEEKPYRIDWNCGGVTNALPAPEGCNRRADQHFGGGLIPTLLYSVPGNYYGNIPQMLKAKAWDIVTIQQASSDSWRPESYEPDTGKLIALIRQLAPHAEILLQETWSYASQDRRFKEWGFGPREMYARLHTAYAEVAARYGLRVIPTGTAVEIYRRELPVVSAPDSLGGDPCGSLAPGGDMVHLNPEGEYLQALVWAQTLLGVDVTVCAYTPAFLSSERAAKMRRAAAEAGNML